MGEQRMVFGEVADVYDDVRPGYPDDLVSEVLAYAGAGVAEAVELGAGTGIGTQSFVDRGLAVRCVEADPQMARVLAARFADTGRVRVDVSLFEDWTPPAAGVRLLFCAQAWHWMPPERRCGLARAALAPGGAVALFSHTYRFADPGMERVVTGVYGEHAPVLLEADPLGRPQVAPEEHWLTVDLASSGLFVDVRAARFARTVRFSRDRYLRLVRTFSPFRMLPAALRPVVLEALGGALDAHGGGVDIWLDTVLALGRRPAG